MKRMKAAVLAILVASLSLAFCLTACGSAESAGGTNQSATAPEAYAFEAQYIRTNGGSDEASYPFHTVISSRAELEAYYEANKDIYNLERREKVYSDSTIGFLDACDKYDDAYFKRQNLVLIVLQEGSGSIRHEITDVRPHRTENGASDGWDITVDVKAPEVVTDDMAQWHLFLEVQMGDAIKPTDKVWINGALSERAPAISGLVGISRTPAIEAYQDPWGVKLTAKNITPSGLTIVCTQQDGEPTGELHTGSYDGFGVSIPLLSGWDYQIEEYHADGMSYGVSFRPVGEEGWIDFHYWPFFGVCGTGLETKEFGNGSMGIYDGSANWSFISYPASKGNFVATTQGINGVWPDHAETAMEIIKQAICTDTIVD